MTEKGKRTLAATLLLTLVSIFALPILTAAWHAKVDRSEYDLHLQEERTHIVRDSARAEEQKALLLDVLCSVKDQRDRRCR